MPSLQSPHGGLTRRIVLGLFAATLGYLVVTWILVAMIDFANVNDFRGAWAERFPEEPLVFMWFFNEARLTERLQWLLLSGALLAAAGLCVVCYARGLTSHGRTFFIGVIGLMVMLFEDSLNLRHALYFDLVMPVLFDEPTLIHPLRSVTELAVYSVLGAAMLVFFLRVVGLARGAPPAFAFLVLGYVMYALAAGASATRYFGNWYEALGGWVAALLAPELSEIYATTTLDPHYTVGFWLMDSLVEESLELVGASALAVALVLIASSIRRGMLSEAPAVRELEAGR
jgi:hypothetical protein